MFMEIMRDMEFVIIFELFFSQFRVTSLIVEVKFLNTKEFKFIN